MAEIDRPLAVNPELPPILQQRQAEDLPRIRELKRSVKENRALAIEEAIINSEALSQTGDLTSEAPRELVEIPVKYSHFFPLSKIVEVEGSPYARAEDIEPYSR
jgi:hypothetical protein